MARTQKSKDSTKTKPQGSRLHTARECFEDAFVQRLGQHPIEWVRMKLEGGSDIGSVRYLYEISAHAIAQENNCVPVPFEHYNMQYQNSKDMVTAPYKSKKTYNKLVRDRIPEIIEANGKTCSYEILTDEEYLILLDAKLNEELAEYQESKSLEELADLLEVLGAVVKARGHSWDELTMLRKKKRADRGGFEKKIMLKDVYDNAGNQEKASKAEKVTASLANAGQIWTELEENKLLDEFDSNMPIADIAIEHGRSIGAIESRLAQLGRISRTTTRSNKN